VLVGLLKVGFVHFVSAVPPVMMFWLRSTQYTIMLGLMSICCEQWGKRVINCLLRKVHW
jgi:hypothetical protein